MFQFSFQLSSYLWFFFVCVFGGGRLLWFKNTNFIAKNCKYTNSDLSHNHWRAEILKKRQRKRFCNYLCRHSERYFICEIWYDSIILPMLCWIWEKFWYSTVDSAHQLVQSSIACCFLRNSMENCLFGTINDLKRRIKCPWNYDEMQHNIYSYQIAAIRLKCQ